MVLFTKGCKNQWNETWWNALERVAKMSMENIFTASCMNA